MVLFFLIPITFATSPEQAVVQIWVDKQQIRSVALGRMATEYDIPLYFQLPIVQEWGTGIAMGEGLILTNYHVVQGARGLGIQTPSSQITPATIVLALPDWDLAWLQIEEDIDLQIWETGREPQIDDPVWMGGFESALNWSQQKGMIQDINRNDILSDEKQSFSIINQVVPPGYSGGPVWNAENQLIGMMTATNPEKNEAYFLAIQDAINAWARRQSDTEIVWGDLGITVVEGQLISVNSYSPARDLPTGKIEQIGGIDVSMNVLDDELRRLAVGQQLKLRIDGEDYLITVRDFSDWGEHKGGCSWQQASLYRETNYWRIVSLEEDSPLRQMGARPDDLLLISETCSELIELNRVLIPLQRESVYYHIILPKHYQR